MQCSYCGKQRSKVVDSRDSGDEIRRRRECLSCGRRYTTEERVVNWKLMVVKRDDRREHFSGEKLLGSLTKACAKRPLPTGRVSKAVEEIEASLGEMGRAEISSHVIGELAMEKLRALDRIAYIRYASVYRDFKGIEDFLSEANALLEPQTTDAANDHQLSFLEDPSPQQPRRRRRPRRTN